MIAALKPGVRRATAVDIDAQVPGATRRNAASHEVADRLSVMEPGQLADHSFDLLLANILAEPLRELAGQPADLVCPGVKLLCPEF